MGLNEDLGDRENVGSAAIAAQRLRDAKRQQSEEAYLKEKYAAALEREHILLEQLAALQWQPITPENLPKVGDEVLYVDGSTVSVDPTDCAVAGEWGIQYWRRVTHFRPIDPPAKEQPADAQKGKQP